VISISFHHWCCGIPWGWRRISILPSYGYAIGIYRCSDIWCPRWVWYHSACLPTKALVPCVVCLTYCKPFSMWVCPRVRAMGWSDEKISSFIVTTDAHFASSRVSLSEEWMLPESTPVSLMAAVTRANLPNAVFHWLPFYILWPPSDCAMADKIVFTIRPVCVSSSLTIRAVEALSKGLYTLDTIEYAYIRWSATHVNLSTLRRKPILATIRLDLLRRSVWTDRVLVNPEYVMY
jgi:hypothetical protein